MAHHTCDFLIIGNSAAGVTAAEFLSAAAPDKSIVMVSNEPYHCYGRPLISYLLEGKTDREHLNYKPADFYEKRGIQTMFGPEFEAVELDPAAHQVKLAGGEEVAYGKCLLATGSVPFVPPIDGMEGRTNVHTFITLDDALGAWGDAREATERAHAEGRESRVVVIGGGLIGMKAAEALSHYVDRIDVFDRSPRILPAVLDEDGAAVVARLMEPHGIYCHAGMSIDEMLGDGDRVTHVRRTDGADETCDMVVVAVGVRPASKLAVEAGAEQGRGLVCGPDLQTSLPDVYAAGDVTQVTDILDGSQRPLALWPNAVRQGRIAATHMAGLPGALPDEGSFAVNAVDFFDVTLLTSGIINPPADGGFDVRVEVEGDEYVKFVTRGDRLMGYVLLNRPDHAGMYTAMIERGVPVSSMSTDVFDRAPLNIDFPQGAARMHRGYPSSKLDEHGWPKAEGEECHD